jgi:hypothetical protein
MTRLGNNVKVERVNNTVQQGATRVHPFEQYNRVVGDVIYIYNQVFTYTLARHPSSS